MCSVTNAKVFTNKKTETFEDSQLCVDNVQSLDEALSKFTHKELLQGSNKYACEKCQHKTNAVKRLLLDQVLPLLRCNLIY